MITNAILLILQNVLNVLLLPFTAINFVVDVASSIPVVASFLQCIAYIIPWGNIYPLIIIVFAMFMFRIGVSLLKTINNIIPFF